MIRQLADVRDLSARLALVGWLSAALAGAATAQDVPPRSEPEATRVDDIVVLGTPLRDQVEGFVQAITAPPRGHGPARWPPRSGICVGVLNLRREVAQAMADRVSEVAAELGLSIGEPGCDPNVLIIAAADAQTLTAALVDDRPTAFRPAYSGAARSRGQLQRFVNEDRPVRWWHVSMPVLPNTGLPAVRMPGGEAPMIGGEGRLRTPVINVLLRTYVVIDLDQVEHLSFRQLTDHVAMVALAQIDPDADVAGFPTILNVVASPGSVSELTDWDRAYLGGVYGAQTDQRAVNAQTGRIADLMFRDRKQAQDQSADAEP